MHYKVFYQKTVVQSFIEKNHSLKSVSVTYIVLTYKDSYSGKKKLINISYIKLLKQFFQRLLHCAILNDFRILESFEEIKFPTRNLSARIKLK